MKDDGTRLNPKRISEMLLKLYNMEKPDEVTNYPRVDREYKNKSSLDF